MKIVCKGKVRLYIRIKTYTKVNLRMAKPMGKENTFKLKDKSMRGIGLMIYLMEKVSRHWKMGQFTMVNLRTVQNMGMVSINGMIKVCIKENGRIMSLMAMVNTLGPTDVDTSANGRKTKCMVKAS